MYIMQDYLGTGGTVIVENVREGFTAHFPELRGSGRTPDVTGGYRRVLDYVREHIDDPKADSDITGIRIYRVDGTDLTPCNTRARFEL